MTLDAQMIFDILIALVGVLLGWLYNNNREEIREMKQEHAKVASKVQDLESTIPKEYASKAALERALDKLENRLDTIQQDIKELLQRQAPPNQH